MVVSMTQESEMVAELFGRDGAYVTVTRETETGGRSVLIIAGRARGRRPYLATIPACPCDLFPCSPSCKQRGSAHLRKCCHGKRHVEHVALLAAGVLSSYRPWRPRPNLPSWGSLLPMKTEAVADALGVTVDEYRSQLTLARD